MSILKNLFYFQLIFLMPYWAHGSNNSPKSQRRPTHPYLVILQDPTKKQNLCLGYVSLPPKRLELRLNDLPTPIWTSTHPHTFPHTNPMGLKWDIINYTAQFSPKPSQLAAATVCAVLGNMHLLHTGALVYHFGNSPTSIDIATAAFNGFCFSFFASIGALNAKDMWQPDCLFLWGPNSTPWNRKYVGAIGHENIEFYKDFDLVVTPAQRQKLARLQNKLEHHYTLQMNTEGPTCHELWENYVAATPHEK